MRRAGLIAAALAVVACSAPSRESFGILGFRGSRPTVFSTARLEDGRRLAAYRIGTWTRRADVVIGSATHATHSLFFDSEGNSDAWEHELSTPEPLAGGDLWVCLATDLTLAGAGEDGATLTKDGEQVGAIRVSLKSEGIEVTASVRGRTERAYYALGYDAR